MSHLEVKKKEITQMWHWCQVSLREIYGNIFKSKDMKYVK